MSNPRRILIVSDEPADDFLVARLTDRGFEVESASELPNAKDSCPDLLIVDLEDPGRAIELVKSVRRSAELRNVLILVTAEWGSGQAALTLSKGADAFEPKPVNAEQLTVRVESLFRPKLARLASAGTTSD